MSTSYLGTVGNTDEAVRRILSALGDLGLAETTLVLITADHGGHGTTHGSARPEDVTIPWLVVGPGVRQGHRLTGPVFVFDTAATAAWALHLDLPADMDGRPILEAFEEPGT
jgi:arylsulfatase A-like enzyme